MDTRSGNVPPSFICTAAINIPKPSLENSSSPSAGLMGPTSGLARYHSAPSSMLASLLEPDPFTARDGSDLVQYLDHGGITEQDYQVQNDMVRSQLRPYMSSTTGREHIGYGPLSAILEHGGEDALASRPSQQSSTMPAPSSTIFDGLLPVKSHLIRHSSLPAELISGLVTGDMSERSFPHVEMVTAPRVDNNKGGKVFRLTSAVSPRAVQIRKSYGEPKADAGSTVMSDELKHHGLLRQSSSPAGLLSQLSLDELSGGGPAAPDMFPRPSVHELVLHGPAVSTWDEGAMDAAMEKLGALGQRKRGRDAEAGLCKGVPTADLLQMGSMDHGSCTPSYLHSAVTTGNTETLLSDSVLCKLRAKRGFATHPRSIAERARRTKISERIRKLQDLVPNLDKQAHIVDMLDEVVEYVKVLQRQVQELSTHMPECNGMCHKVERASAERA